uniref:Uncharacterized protein n=1 Tax=Oryza glumipatula TaxID=40148 RepID=A0A0D9YBW5_9ORYZ
MTPTESLAKLPIVGNPDSGLSASQYIVLHSFARGWRHVLLFALSYTAVSIYPVTSVCQFFFLVAAHDMVATALQPKPGSGQPSSLPQAPPPLRFEAPV